MYRLYFSAIYFFNKAKNEGISIDLARLFNAVEGKKRLKLVIDNCEQLLNNKKPYKLEYLQRTLYMTEYPLRSYSAYNHPLALIRMKNIVITIIVFGILGCKTETQDDKMVFSTQNVSNNSPMEFMEHLIPNDKLIHKGVFNPELNEYYYTLSDKEFKQFDVFVIKKIDQKWSNPELAFFNSSFSDHGMNFNPSGTSIYFSSTRPTGYEGVSNTWHIWKSDRIGGKWQEPEYIDITNLRDKLVSHPTITKTGVLYFHSSNLDYSDMNIYQANKIDGKFEQARLSNISPSKPNIQKCTPYVSAKEDYILFATIGNQLDLMIAFNDGSGNWVNTRKLSEAINVNGQGNPYVTPDDRFLFYTTGKTEQQNWRIKWVNFENELKSN